MAGESDLSMVRQFARIAGVSAVSSVFPRSYEDFAARWTAGKASCIDVRFLAEEAPQAIFPKHDWRDVRALLLRTVDAAPLGGGEWLLRNPLSREALPIRCSQEYRQITVYCLDNTLLQRNEALSLLRTVVECRFCYESIVSLHAACIEGDSYAVCFTGDSGVGKSTRAKTWIQGLGARFISGDRPAIRLEQDGCTVCGVPWDGKEQIFRNVERSLMAILEVRRAPFTRLRRLSVDQAYSVLMRQSFIPMWDANTAALAMMNVRRLSCSAPVYRLFCGPDVLAARETYHILFEAPETIREEMPDMQIKENFILRNIGDEHMVMPTGENIARFGGAVVLSDTAAFIFEQLKQPISREDLLALVLFEFDVDAETAAQDLDELIKQFEEMGILEG